MNLIAFDTSTDRMSLAVQRDHTVCTIDAPGGAQASATVVPHILALMQQAGVTFETLDAIVFGRGPGSFTGLRTACAVAQGLAMGAKQGQGVPVLPIDTLLAVAEDARDRTGCTQVVAVLDARMNEVYAAQLQWQTATSTTPEGWVLDSAMTLSAPQAITVPAGYTLAGNAAAVYGADLAQGTHCTSAWPTASALLRLAPALWAAGMQVPASAALPLYIRDKVANTTAERMAQKQMAAMADTLPTPPAPPIPSA